MSEIREYLEEKAALAENEWLRREPRTTHAAILDAVRAFEAGGGTYNDDAERYVEEVAGDLPEHYHHAHEKRHRLTDQLGSEVYIAKGILRDEEATAKTEERAASGFEAVRLDGYEFKDGGRYEVSFGTLYVGRSEVSYGEAREVRAVRSGERFVLLPKRARTRGYAASGLALIRAL
jgi:hypothetical protein